METFTVDNLSIPGIRQLSQPEKGYRFSIDPFILAAHVKQADNRKILDIGCGCGIIAIILASRFPCLKVAAIEIQEELYLYAKKNVAANKLENSIDIIHNDIKNIQIKEINGKADIIVCNPPYKKSGSGRVNPDSQKAIARHEIMLDIDMLFKSSGRLIKKGGRLYLIFPASRLADLFKAMNHYNFSPDFIRFIHIKQKTAAKRVILCAAKDSNISCIVHPPFYIYEDDNKFSREYISLFHNV